MVELVSAAGEPLSYEVLRHILRLTEADMIDTLAETVRLGLVRRSGGPPALYDLSPGLAASVRDSLGVDRLATLRRQVAGARERVHGRE